MGPKVGFWALSIRGGPTRSWSFTFRLVSLIVPVGFGLFAEVGRQGIDDVGSASQPESTRDERSRSIDQVSTVAVVFLIFGGANASKTFTFVVVQFFWPSSRLVGIDGGDVHGALAWQSVFFAKDVPHFSGHGIHLSVCQVGDFDSSRVQLPCSAHGADDRCFTLETRF